MKGRLFCLFLCLCTALCGCRTAPAPARPTVAGCSVAAFSRAGEGGYKLITGEIASLYTFDSLDIVPADGPFTGPWLYRIVCNPQGYASRFQELVILFGQENLSVGGQTYRGGDGVDYAHILAWAEGKYEYFDYELIPDP